jgi:hypothetical protein
MKNAATSITGIAHCKTQHRHSTVEKRWDNHASFAAKERYTLAESPLISIEDGLLLLFWKLKTKPEVFRA